jgi:hypothetical protein
MRSLSACQSLISKLCAAADTYTGESLLLDVFSLIGRGMMKQIIHDEKDIGYPS